mmetsp:Transcript_143153/g.372972  ORF Transcript_143153/g.372972 Transcript_143153/m.372972 type:complete len:255 (+) Transcript_143153:887-1651(+)
MWQCWHSWPFAHPWGFQNHAHGLQSPVPCSSDPADAIGAAANCGTLPAAATPGAPGSGDRGGAGGSDSAAAGDAGDGSDAAAAGDTRGDSSAGGTSWGTSTASALGWDEEGQSRPGGGASTAGSGTSTMAGIDDMVLVRDSSSELQPLFFLLSSSASHPPCSDASAAQGLVSRRAPSFAFRRALISPEEHMWQCWQSRPFWQPPAFQYQAQGLQQPVPCIKDPTEARGPCIQLPKSDGPCLESSECVADVESLA